MPNRPGAALLDQMGTGQRGQQPGGGRLVGAEERGGGVTVDVTARMQAEEPERTARRGR